jgi:hypothetical protein
MTTYAAWDGQTQDWLRNDYDDTYTRPIISFLPDDPHEEDDHSLCQICQSFDFGARWVPDNGGAWVYSSSWQAAQHSVKKYQGKVAQFTIF